MNLQESMFPQSADEELVRLAQEGNDEAFAELIRRHHASCMKQALMILRHPQDAEDEVQNACWKAFVHLGKFEGNSMFSTWLIRIVVNQCLMRLRKQRRAKLFYVEETVEAEGTARFEFPDNRLNPEAELGRSEVRELVLAEITRIPPLFRSVIELRDLKRLPMQQVADQLGISLAAAKSRLLRARLELKERLVKHCGELGPATLTA